jgi:nicotinate-nucleotide adenylyltransferase
MTLCSYEFPSQLAGLVERKDYSSEFLSEVTDALTKRRIGVYGGTFDPIHDGHIEVARSILRRFNLDTLLLVLAACPPHKDPGSISMAYHRYAMAAMASLDVEGISVSSLELEHSDRPYTFETMGTLRCMHGEEAAIFLILGSDSFEDLHKWREPERILESCSIIVAARPGYEITELAAMLGGKDLHRYIEDLRGVGADDRRGAETPRRGAIYLTDLVEVDISSTDIRERVSRGMSIEGMVPVSVERYIRKYGLYRGAN